MTRDGFGKSERELVLELQANSLGGLIQEYLTIMGGDRRYAMQLMVKRFNTASNASFEGEFFIENTSGDLYQIQASLTRVVLADIDLTGDSCKVTLHANESIGLILTVVFEAIVPIVRNR